MGPAQVYVGIIFPKAAPTGIYAFDLCLESRCVPGGQLSTFNRGPSTPSRVESSTHKLVEYDVTDTVESEGWQDLEVTARVVTNTVVDGLPGPVIIERFGGSSGGNVTLAQGYLLADYGDLLEEYNMDLNSIDINIDIDIDIAS